VGSICESVIDRARKLCRTWWSNLVPLDDLSICVPSVAAINTRNGSLAFEQLAISHAAYDSLTCTFHGTRNFGKIFKAAQDILEKIGISEEEEEYARAVAIGRKPALKVTTARQDDGINNFINYVYQPATPGVYQRTPGPAFVAPDTPQARYLRPFGGLQNITRFCAPPPPSLNSLVYEAFLNCTKAQGERNSTTRTPYDTETAFFWRETSTIQRNRLASNVIGTRYAKNVFTSQPSTYSSTTRSSTPQSLLGH
jgi:hypothetical protein